MPTLMPFSSDSLAGAANGDMTNDVATMDLNALARWMDERGIGVGPIIDVRRLGGGTQNLIVAFHRDGTAYVLRRPPVGSGAAGDEIMRREAAVLGALADTAVPHPRLIAAELGREPLGSAFHLSEFVDGSSAVGGHAQALSERSRHVLGLAVADALVELAALDPSLIGLGSVGRPAGFLERQVGRWRWQLEGYHDVDGYTDHNLPHVEEVVDWLECNRPVSQASGIVHGDVHLGNVLFHRDRPAVAALVDWELTTVGDPLLDLAQLLVTWPDSTGQSVLGDIASPLVPGFATEAEILERYRAATTRDMSAIQWYLVLASFRLGTILEGTRARACAGLAPIDVGELLHGAACRLLHVAHRRACGAGAG